MYEVETDLAGFAGDWHGNTRWALRCLEKFHDLGIPVVYHVGDFGIWGGPNGSAYLQALNKKLTRYGMILIVVPGNHENYDMLERWPLNPEGFISRTTDLDRIWCAPRGHTWLHNGARVVALGGAFSIDKYARKPGFSWWPQESITQADVDTLITNLDMLEWDTVDLFLSHDLPAGLDVGKKEFKLSPELEWESYQQRLLLRQAVDRARPHSQVHGHWHKYLRNTLEGVGTDSYLTSYTTEVYGLDCDGFNNNLMTARIEAGSPLLDVRMLPWN
jgi:Calcineurin-like phosphoesterase